MNEMGLYNNDGMPDKSKFNIGLIGPNVDVLERVSQNVKTISERTINLDNKLEKISHRIDNFITYTKIVTLVSGLVYSGYKLFQIYSKRKSDK